MKNFIRKIFGVEEIESQIKETLRKKLEAEKEAELAQKIAEESQEQLRLAKLTPKELATEKKESWVSVLNTHVNKDNIRNGFFELDWNEYFIMELKESGYFGNSEEEIIDKWFQELCRNIGNESGVNMERRGSGYVNRALRDDGKTEIS
jgi:arginyl-tRNA synthetase